MMRKTILTACFALCLNAAAPAAHAVLIGLTPSTTSTGIGGPVLLDLTVSGLGNGAAPSLGAFDIDVAFDSSVLAFTGATFGVALGDLGLFEAIASVVSPTPGVVNLFEVSLLEADAASCILCFGPFLDDIQSNSFVLASLSFTALSAGASDVTPSSILLGDGFGFALTTTGVSGARVIVAGAVSVSEPGSLMLYGIGLLGLIGLSYRRPERQRAEQRAML